MPRVSRKHEILSAAMQLFAEKGVRGVSLREVNAYAKMSSAALHYHFKSREDLVKCLIETIAPDYFIARAAWLEQLQRDLDNVDMLAVVNALIRAMTVRIEQEPEQGFKELRFLARLYFDNSDDLGNVFENSWKVFKPFLTKLLPDVTETELRRRWLFATDLGLHSLVELRYYIPVVASDQGVVSSGKKNAEEFENYLQALIRFIAAGIEQPLNFYSENSIDLNVSRACAS